MTGIIIGRFQVPYLHPGHLHLIATALRECDKVVILLGLPHDLEDEQIAARNPYRYQQRKDMISRIFPQVEIYPQDDFESDEEWSRDVDDFISNFEEMGYYKDSVLYHSRDSFKSSYSGKYPLREIEQVGDYSGTKLRKST